MPLWMQAAELLGRSVLVLLFGLSIWSLSIIINQLKYYKKIKTYKAEEIFKKAIQEQNLTLLKEASTSQIPFYSGLAETFLNANQSKDFERSFNSFVTSTKPELEKGLNTLATLGSNAPFIGLLGTVIGIIQAFGTLSLTSSGTSSVMSSISEALIATAVGLFVAIPAVIAYNYISHQMRNLLLESDSLKDLYLSKK